MVENNSGPSSLVFGIIPHFPIISTEMPTHKQRTGAFKSVKIGKNFIVVERGIQLRLYMTYLQLRIKVISWGKEI